jgi:osmoprotectant transport system substrate-binding protein
MGLTRGAIVCVLSIFLVAVSPFAPRAADKKKVTVGNKNFTEQYIIGALMKQVLEAGGFEVRLRPDLTSMALRAGMESGHIDICADYTGTAWMVYLKRKHDPGTDNDTLYSRVRDEDGKNGFVWLNPLWNNNTYAMASWPEFVKERGLKSLSDLAGLYRREKGQITTFVNFEFSTRPDGMAALEAFYDFHVAKDHLKTGTPGTSLIGLREKQADVAMVFGTDASVAKYGWHIYLDDKRFFPPYDLTPCVRKEVLSRYPDIAGILNALTATFPGGGGKATPREVAECQKIWQGFNAKVDIDRMEPEAVAHEYLQEHGLVRD